MGDDMTVDGPGSLSASEARFRRQLPLMFASWAAMAFLCVVVIVKLHGHWHTGLFIWGLSLGVVGILNQQVSIHLFPRFAGLTKQDARLKRQPYALRKRVNVVTFLVMGVTLGVVTAKTGFVGLDIALTVVLGASLCIALIAAFVRGGRARRSREAGPGD